MASPAVLVADLGSTSIKAAVIAADGSTLAETREADAVIVDDGARSEGEPEAWWRQFAAASAAAMAGAGNAPIGAIAITGLTRTQIFLDDAWRPTRPAITWRDTRAAEIAATLPGADDADAAARPTAFDPLARIAWVRMHEPAVFAATRVVLDPKDYLNLRLTGVAASDAVTLGRFDCPALGRSLAERCAALGLPASLFAMAREPGERIGLVRGGLAAPFDRLAGRPVIACGYDTWCNTLGAGANRARCGYVVSGTTEVAGLVVDRPRPAPGLISLPWGGGLHHLGGPSQSGLDTFAWFGGDVLAGDAFAQLRALDPAPPADDDPIFLPYLTGERVPLWRADVRGAFVGLGRRHDQAVLLQAVITGIAFANRQVFDLATAGDDAAMAELRITGGGAAFDAWGRIKADVLGRPVRCSAVAETGLLGAAIAALVGLGVFASFAAAQDRLARAGRQFAADPERHRTYSALYRRFLAAQRALLA